MPFFRALPTGPPLSVIERPCCQNCQTRTILRRTAPGPGGYEFHAFECPKCDRVQRTLVVSDPMTGDAKGWLRGELKFPDSILAISTELKWPRAEIRRRSHF
jgi:hypothetical protein